MGFLRGGRFLAAPSLCMVPRQMSDRLQDLPSIHLGSPYSMDEATKVLGAVLRAMESRDSDLSDLAWEGYVETLEMVCDEGTKRVPLVAVQTARYSLDTLRGVAYCGDCLLASARCCLSALLLNEPNPFSELRVGRPPGLDDVGVLIEKAIWLAREARACDPFDGGIEFDPDRDEKLGQSRQDDFMQSLIDNAIRPRDAS